MTYWETITAMATPDDLRRIHERLDTILQRTTETAAATQRELADLRTQFCAFVARKDQECRAHHEMTGDHAEALFGPDGRDGIASAVNALSSRVATLSSIVSVVAIGLASWFGRWLWTLAR